MAGIRDNANATVNMSNFMYTPGPVCFMCTKSINPFQTRFSRSTVAGQNYEILLTEFLALALELSVEDVFAMLSQHGQGRDMPLFLLCENCEVGMAGITRQLFRELYGAQERLARKLGEMAEVLQSASTFIGMGAVQSFRKLLGSKCKRKMEEIRFHLWQRGVKPNVKVGNERNQPPSQFRGPHENNNAGVRGQVHSHPRSHTPYASNSQAGQVEGQMPFPNANHELGISFNCHWCLQSFKDIEGCRRHAVQCQRPLYQVPLAVSTPNGPTSDMMARVEMRNPVNLSVAPQLSNSKNKKKKTHKCPECGKLYYTKSKLEVHLKLHTRDKPFLYSCSKCNKAFRQKGQCKKHEKICKISRNHNNSQNHQVEKNRSFATPATVKKLSPIHMESSLANFSPNVTNGTVSWQNRVEREKEMGNSSNSTPAAANGSVAVKDKKLCDMNTTDQFMTFYYQQETDFGSNQGGYRPAFQGGGGGGGVPVPNQVTDNHPKKRRRESRGPEEEELDRRVPQLHQPQSPRPLVIDEHGLSQGKTPMSISIKQEPNFED